MKGKCDGGGDGVGVGGGDGGGRIGINSARYRG